MDDLPRKSRGPDGTDSSERMHDEAWLEHPFCWSALAPAIGRSWRSTALRDAFAQARLDPQVLTQELRVGIDSMAPRDDSMTTAFEIDLSPSHAVRLRFRPARELVHPPDEAPDEPVLSGVTYFLDGDARASASAGLPAGMQPDDDPARVMQRLGAAPSESRLDDPSQGWMLWSERIPAVHALFRMPEGKLQKITCFLRLRP